MTAKKLKVLKVMVKTYGCPKVLTACVRGSHSIGKMIRWSFLKVCSLAVFTSAALVSTDHVVHASDLSSSHVSSPPEFMREYRIGGNDILEITVYGEDDLTQEVRVSGSGYITYPLLGRIQVADLSVMELEDHIRQALAKDYIRDPTVRVFVKEFSNIYVFGEVENPGPYFFKGGMTVLQAITTAGGFSDIANKRKVRIVRGRDEEKEIIHVNVNDIANGSAEDIVLQPGDTVVVPESFF